MSNCRFHYLSSKQTGKFTNLQIPMVGRWNVVIWGWRQEICGGLPRRLLPMSWQTATMWISITFDNLDNCLKHLQLLPAVATTDDWFSSPKEGNHRNLARNLWIQQRNLLGDWLPPLRPSSKMAKRFRENCKDLVRRVRYSWRWGYSEVSS